MFFYAPMLTWIVIGSLPVYVAISGAVTPLFRRRLDENSSAARRTRLSWSRASPASRR